MSGSILAACKKGKTFKEDCEFRELVFESSHVHSPDQPCIADRQEPSDQAALCVRCKAFDQAN